tara:strand:- start:1137 stop:1451 length:315 start_codon:yes stop_codon:yes gene_type:complete
MPGRNDLKILDRFVRTLRTATNYVVVPFKRHFEVYEMPREEFDYTETMEKSFVDFIERSHQLRRAKYKGNVKRLLMLQMKIFFQIHGFHPKAEDVIRQLNLLIV